MIWVNGQLVSGAPKVVDALDRGFLLGDGIFETLKVSRGRAMFLNRHLARLQGAANALRLPVDLHQVRGGVAEILATEAATSGALRITVSRGTGPRGLAPIPRADQSPVVLIAFTPASPGPDALDRLVPAPFIRASAAITARYKTLSYADNLAAIAHAEREGAADVLFVNERGEVSSTAMANIFVRTERGYLTPPLASGILPGIVRSVLLDEAAGAGIKVEVRPLTIDEVKGRLLFRTNSLLGVRRAWFDDDGGVPPAFRADDAVLGGLYRTAQRRQEGA